MTGVLLDYPHRMAGHCGSGALRDQLDRAGLGWGGPPSEALVFALGGALDFGYVRSDALQPPIYLIGRGGGLEKDLPHRLGAQLEVRSTDDPELGWQWVTSEIDAGHPAMVWADIGELPYLRVRLTMSRHDIVVIGYDDDTRTAFVVDNDRADVQHVPYDALARARASTAFPLPTRHTTYVIRWPARPPDLRAAAADAFAQGAATMTTSAAPSLGPGLTSHVSGLAAVQVFVDDLANWPHLFPGDGLHTVLLGLAAFIEKAGTGGGLFRRLLSDGAREIAEHTGDRATAAAAEATGACAAVWTAIAAAAADKESTPADRLARARRHADELVHRETQAVQALQVAAASLGRAAAS